MVYRQDSTMVMMNPDQYLIDNSWDDDECKETDEFAQIVYNRLNNIEMDNNVNEQEIATTNIYNREYTPDMIRNLAENEIFVFGSNIYGSHGGGAARFAYDHFGAEWGVGEGLTGRTYAIPTMEGGVNYIRGKVNTFLEFARNNQDKKFLVTPIACGIAGFRKREIAPLFAEALTMENVILPEDFVSILCNRN